MTRSRAVRRITLAGLLGLVSVLVSGCSFADLPRYGWPEGITPQAERMQEFWSASFTAALLVGVGVWGLMFWAFIVYRKRKNGPLYPKQTKENLPLELIYTAVPFLMVGVLFYFTVTTENFVLDKRPRPGRDDRRHRVQVELGLRLPGTPRCPAAARCTPSAPAKRSRSWCCR